MPRFSNPQRSNPGGSAHRSRPALVVLAGALAAAGLAGCGASHAEAAGSTSSSTSTCPSGTPTVTAHGEGSAQGPPDLLTITLGVQTSAASAASALSENASSATALVAQLKADGVAAADLQTSGLSIQPVYSGNPPVIRSYQVTNTVTARLHDLSQDGTVIDDAARAAGNAIQVDGIAFSIQDDTALAGQARGAAVRQAATYARAMAQGAGASLGRLCSLVDQTTSPVVVPTFSAAAGSASAGTPIEPGTQQVTADVTAVYRLNG